MLLMKISASGLVAKERRAAKADGLIVMPLTAKVAIKSVRKAIERRSLRADPPLRLAKSRVKVRSGVRNQRRNH